MSPLANSYVEPEALQRMEPFFPLHVWVCEHCLLVQLPETESPEAIFSDYAYFSSYSTSWLRHAESYVAAMVERFGFDRESQIVEIASNDGYLLQYFQRRGIPVLGVEPAGNVAQAAQERGIRTLVKFFNTKTATELVDEGLAADLLLGDNVLAHVPGLNDFVEGLKIALKPGGVVTMEFPHLMRLMAENQFDTIYHEHFSYLSLLAVQAIFAAHGLVIYDVEELPTHGGSLRIFARHAAHEALSITQRVTALLDTERSAGLDGKEAYDAFRAQVEETKRALLEFLITAKRAGKSVVGYGAAAKGNTLLNYCGIRGDFLDYVVDRSPHKQGRFLPGTQLPILAPEQIAETKPDYLLILPWNIRDEIVEQMADIRSWGGQFVVPIPQVTVIR